MLVFGQGLFKTLRMRAVFAQVNLASQFQQPCGHDLHAQGLEHDFSYPYKSISYRISLQTGELNKINMLFRFQSAWKPKMAKVQMRSRIKSRHAANQLSKILIMASGGLWEYFVILV